MTILTFLSHFPTEQTCREHFKSNREKIGIKCKHCNSLEHYWLDSKWQWQCKSCGFRTTLRSGTIMQYSNLPVKTCYLAFIFMSFTKKGISACELQRQLGYKKYDTIWYLMHRIRTAMGNRDKQYTLEGMIEFDEAYFEKATSENIKLMRGKGSHKQKNVAVMAESTFLEQIDTQKVSKQCRYYKMEVLDSYTKDSTNKTVYQNIENTSIVLTDKSKSM